MGSISFPCWPSSTWRVAVVVVELAVAAVAYPVSIVLIDIVDADVVVAAKLGVFLTPAGDVVVAVVVLEAVNAGIDLGIGDVDDE